MQTASWMNSSRCNSTTPWTRIEGRLHAVPRPPRRRPRLRVIWLGLWIDGRRHREQCHGDTDRQQTTLTGSRNMYRLTSKYQAGVCPTKGGIYDKVRDEIGCQGACCVRVAHPAYCESRYAGSTYHGPRCRVRHTRRVDRPHQHFCGDPFQYFQINPK